MPNFKFFDSQGKQQEGSVEMADYAAARDQKISLTQRLQRKYSDADPKRGTVLEQMACSAGIFVRSDHKTGIQSTTMKDVMDGTAAIAMGNITRNDGNDQSIAGRILFPEVVMQIMAAELLESNDDWINSWNSMIALTQNIDTPMWSQPIINDKAPEGISAQAIAQLAEPTSLVSITTSQISRRIPTKSIGLVISDEAQQATTLDLVSIILNAHSRGQRIALAEQDMKDCVVGDSDRGLTALSAFKVDTLDSSINTAGTITQKAWVHYIHDNYRKMSITDIICDIDTALAIEGRANRPTIQTDNPNSPRIDAVFTVDNLAMSAPKLLIVDSDVFGANAVVGLDRRAALRKVINVSATYAATEEFVMRRGSGLRIDFGESTTRLYDDAWSYMTLDFTP